MGKAVTEFWLPFPVSVNELFANNNGRGRGRFRTKEYERWISDAGTVLASQHIRPILGRCMVTIDLDNKRKGDADNRAKPVLDLLVHCGLLGGDSKKYVRRVSIGWEPIDECRVTIEEAA